LTLLVATTPDQNAISGRRTPYKQHQIRDGDWECHECGFRVFETKSQCFKCGAIKAGANPTSVRLTRRARVHKQEASVLKEMSDHARRQSLAGLLGTGAGR